MLAAGLVPKVGNASAAPFEDRLRIGATEQGSRTLTDALYLVSVPEAVHHPLCHVALGIQIWLARDILVSGSQ